MRIQVNTEEVFQTSVFLKNQANEYEQMIRKIQSTIHETSSIWQGKDNEALIQKMDSFQPQLLRIKSVMEQYAAYLNACAIQYNQLQQERMMAARRLA